MGNLVKIAGLAFGVAICVAPARAVDISGCGALFSAVGSARMMEIATGSSPEPAASAREFVRWRTWSLMASGIDPEWASAMDVAAGASMSGMEEYPDGAGACVALSIRKWSSGEWTAKAMGEASQKTIDELARIDGDLANQEVARMVLASKAQNARRQ